MDHIPMGLRNCPGLRVLESSPQPFAENVGVKLKWLVKVRWASDGLSTLNIIIRATDKSIHEYSLSESEFDYDEEYDPDSGETFAHFQQRMITMKLYNEPQRNQGEWASEREAEVLGMLDELAIKLRN
ncbi:hypothetical protein BGX23_007308 [Mortierella sp. AD031]|nr:hypothetical protein BGX23_007308 [Mortierella sp. AD031]